jgi:hypothetical protein
MPKAYPAGPPARAPFLWHCRPSGSGSRNARRARCPAPKSGDREERRRAQLVSVTMPLRTFRSEAEAHWRSATAAA